MPASRKSRSRSRAASRKSRSRRAASRAASRKSRRRAASRKSRKDRRRRRAAQRGGVMEYDRATSGEQLLNSSMAAAARVAPLDAAFAEIRALDAPVAGPMQGGRKRAASRKASRKSRKASRKQRGGQQNISAPTMLLDSGMYKNAGLNPEWKQYQ
jgi:hypothetical protein